NYDDALAQIVGSVININAMTAREHDKLRRAAKQTSKQATWENFMEYYSMAYANALEQAQERSSQKK
ncbi:MAG: glycosyl transferase, partial [Muribaculaceae bacterium]|nr:glycosyl transferase [Muribaculaceae bacterium]